VCTSVPTCRTVLTPQRLAFGERLRDRAASIGDPVNHLLDLRGGQFRKRGRAKMLRGVPRQFPVSLHGLGSTAPRCVLIEPVGHERLKGR
jgi:hypothetical protein